MLGINDDTIYTDDNNNHAKYNYIGQLVKLSLADRINCLIITTNEI